MREISLVVCGTVMFDGVLSTGELEERLSPDILTILREADVSVCDFETVVSGCASPVRKAVSLIVAPEYAHVLSAWGFTHANCIHNHSLDGGLQGFKDTLRLLREARVVPLSGASLISGSQQVVETVRGHTVALLAYSAIGEIASRYDAFETALNEITVYRRQCDHVIVFYHDGYDLAPIPLPSDQERYRALARAGADVVFVNQSHVFQGYETYAGVPIILSTGNLMVHSLADLHWAPINKGAIIRVSLGKSVQCSYHFTRINSDLSVRLDPDYQGIRADFFHDLSEWYAGGAFSKWDEFSARGVVAGPFLAQQLTSGLPQWWKKYGMLGLIRVMRVYLNRFHRQLVLAWFAAHCGIYSRRYERFHSRV